MATLTDQQNALKTESKTFRIVVLDNIAGEGLEILESTPGIEYEVHTGLAGEELAKVLAQFDGCLLYTSPSPRDATLSRMPSSA